MVNPFSSIIYCRFMKNMKIKSEIEFTVTLKQENIFMHENLFLIHCIAHFMK